MIFLRHDQTANLNSHSISRKEPYEFTFAGDVEYSSPSVVKTQSVNCPSSNPEGQLHPTNVCVLPTAVQCARRPVSAPAKKKLKKAGQSHSCGPRANTEPHPTGSRIFVPQDLGPQMAADIPDPPPAAAPTPPIVEPPVCRGGGLGGGQASSVEGRDSRSSDESLPPLPAPSQISPEPRRVQREVPMVVSCGILSLQHMNFKLEPPAFYVPIVSVNYIYELASNLLFMSLNWVCTLPAFENLEERDRRALLRHSWSDLVLLGAAQCSRAFPNSAFLSLIGSHAHQNRLRGTGNRNKISRGQVTAVRNYITNLQKVTNMDPVEYAHLRAAAVFNPGMRSGQHYFERVSDRKGHRLSSLIFGPVMFVLVCLQVLRDTVL